MAMATGERAALSLVAGSRVNRAGGRGMDAQKRAGGKGMDAQKRSGAALAKQSEQSGKIRAAARSAPAPLPFTRHTGLQMVVSAAKCPTYKSTTNGRPAVKAKTGQLKGGTEIHVLEELSDRKCTWVRCKHGWIPLTDEYGKRTLRVLHEEAALPTPTGRQVVKVREGSVQAVMETLQMDKSEMSTAWSTASPARDELCLTFVTKGQLGFDLDASCSRVVSIDANATGPVCTDLQVGMTVRAVQSTAIQDLSSAQRRKLWSSTSHLRPFAVSFVLSTGRKPRAYSPQIDEISIRSSVSSCDNESGGREIRRMGGKITELSTASRTELCARASEAAMNEDIANAKLDPNRWAQLSALLADVGWITWSEASNLGMKGGENLVGKRVAVLGEGFGIVQSYQGARRFGSSGVHHVSFDNRCSVKAIKLEKKNGARWLLFNVSDPPDREEDVPLRAPPPTPVAASDPPDREEDVPLRAPPPTPVAASQSLSSPATLLHFAQVDSTAKRTTSDVHATGSQSTPRALHLVPAQTPSSTFKIVID